MTLAEILDFCHSRAGGNPEKIMIKTLFYEIAGLKKDLPDFTRTSCRSTHPSRKEVCISHLFEFVFSPDDTSISTKEEAL